MKIIAVDAGNRTDVYKFIGFARQVFTIYQLAHLITYELPKILEQLSSDKKYYVGVCELLAMFMSDPHIEKVDTRQP